MATEEEEKTWGAGLEEAGYVIRRIDLQNDAMMEAIYTLFEMTKDFPKQTQLADFIFEEQWKQANGEKRFISFIFSSLNIFNFISATSYL